METQINALVTLVIAFLSIISAIGVSAMGIMAFLLMGAKKEVSDLRKEVGEYRAIADKLETDAKLNVNQIWNRLDSETRDHVQRMLDYITGVCPSAPKKEKP